MLGKLFRYEMKSYYLQIGITCLVGVLATLLLKIVSMLPLADAFRKQFLQAMSYSAYTSLISLVGVAVQVFVVLRFYQTVASDRGYLTFTLPVKTSVHIWSKLLAGTVWQIAASIFMALGMYVFMSGNYWEPEVMPSFSDLMREISSVLPDFSAKYILPCILILLIWVVFMVVRMLMFYMCIAIGQLYGKWRILASVVAYVLLVILLYIIGVIGVVGLLSTLSEQMFQSMAAAGGFAVLNGALAGALVVGVVIGLLFFLCTNRLLDRHLNLD